MLVADTHNARIVVADARGETLHTLKGPVGTLRSPCAIAVAPTGQVLVVDWRRGLVVVFAAVDNDTVHTLGDGEGSGPRQLDGPSDVAIIAADRPVAVVADTGNGRLSLFRVDDDTLLGYVGSGQFLMPTAVAVHGSELLVAESGRVQVLTLQGTPLRVYEAKVGHLRAVSMMADEVLAVDETNQRVVSWSGGDFRVVCAVPHPLGLVVTRQGVWVSGQHQLYLIR